MRKRRRIIIIQSRSLEIVEKIVPQTNLLSWQLHYQGSRSRMKESMIDADSISADQQMFLHTFKEMNISE